MGGIHCGIVILHFWGVLRDIVVGGGGVVVRFCCVNH